MGNKYRPFHYAFFETLLYASHHSRCYIYNRSQVTQKLFILMTLAIQEERQVINIRNNSITVC